MEWTIENVADRLRCLTTLYKVSFLIEKNGEMYFTALWTDDTDSEYVLLKVDTHGRLFTKPPLLIQARTSLWEFIDVI
ncbi:hypothetical protein [Salibacterium aidingense]|uniref:hypothetical protein n=1 Tax=Salibacterium aidingense TaxID=384933 RepID=UPI00040BBE24|nr:hypothetical protein [Salibacterium aidingense]